MKQLQNAPIGELLKTYAEAAVAHRETMNTRSTNWVGVEAKKDGFPVLMRIQKLIPDPSFNVLFVVTWSYPENNANRLPSQNFYSVIESFGKNVDVIEKLGVGIFVASETGLGNMRHYFYTNSADSLATKLDKAIPANEKVEFASSIGNEWSEYGRFAKLIK